MRLADWFRALQHLRLIKITEFFDAKVRQQRWWKPLARLVQKLLGFLWRLVCKIFTSVGKRVVNFFRFFLYLNFSTLREAVDRANKQRLTGLSAEMAYHAMLALFPAILASIAAIGLFESLQSTLFDLARQIATVVPDEVRSTIRSLIQEVLESRNQEIFSIGFAGALWAFSGVMGAAMAALDRIHEIPHEQTRPFWKAKPIAIVLSVGTIILLIVASFLTFISDAIVRLLARRSCLIESGQECLMESGLLCLLEPIESCPLESQLLDAWQVWSRSMTLVVVSAAFAFIYRFGPSQRHPETPILPGAAIAAVLWAVISNLFRLYVSHFGNYNRTYGAVGTIVILLLWLYLSSLVTLFGAQLNVTVGAAMRRAKATSEAIRRRRREANAASHQDLQS
ncbi:YihY/virulence factor BrkB family protein [Oxynema sp. CENA135]|uniref:YihY/virulence factor BrkB family protein n=1 Tax=Oxynema sp. CENA135 TaxID=984206 RepID=UPI00190B6CAA|nr:YihY/virulence factor BrkB family protein [Oxynema sp. CENA135]MBK4728673.1 YihY/virulence factor BrkB family protein [Oxynema sp. CENA135]